MINGLFLCGKNVPDSSVATNTEEKSILFEVFAEEARGKYIAPDTSSQKNLLQAHFWGRVWGKMIPKQAGDYGSVAIMKPTSK